MIEEQVPSQSGRCVKVAREQRDLARVMWIGPFYYCSGFHPDGV